MYKYSGRKQTTVTKDLWRSRSALAAVLMALLLGACSSTAPSGVSSSSSSSNSGRYAMQHDSPLLEHIDIASIAPVIPRQELRTLAGNRSPYTINGVTYRVLESEAGYTETGMASWYGRKFHGHLTSNGEVYDMFQLSAAHTRLPIPSYVRVTNLDNGKSLIARVNDRGPFHPGRIVDLSYAGAVMLDYADKGGSLAARKRAEGASATADARSELDGSAGAGKTSYRGKRRQGIFAGGSLCQSRLGSSAGGPARGHDPFAGDDCQ
jgi:rare lipoprotein A (peptidoglycan hydrolase)